MADDEDDFAIRLVWQSEASGPVPPPYPGLVVTDLEVSYGPLGRLGALEAAEGLSAGVRRPFVVLST